MLNCVIVGIGGFIGSVCRYLLSMIPISEQTQFPIKTFCINVAGAFLIGVIVAVSQKHSAIDPRLLLFLKVGVCGGFTTFSTFALETFDLIKAGSAVTAVLYIVLSVVLSVAAVLAAKVIFSV